MSHPHEVSSGHGTLVGYDMRVVALYGRWEEPPAEEPAGVYKHDDGRPLLGRKVRGKSQCELRDLGLTVKEPTSVAGG
jgi:hypothetical protein